MSDFGKALIYKTLVDVPLLILLSWIWFGHPGHILWFFGVTATVGTVFLLMFEKFWRVRQTWKYALPLAGTWLAMVIVLFVSLWMQSE